VYEWLRATVGRTSEDTDAKEGGARAAVLVLISVNRLELDSDVASDDAVVGADVDICETSSLRAYTSDACRNPGSSVLNDSH